MYFDIRWPERRVIERDASRHAAEPAHADARDQDARVHAAFRVHTGIDDHGARRRLRDDKTKALGVIDKTQDEALAQCIDAYFLG